ncbi:uncharacterized protein PHALS_05309 [Plasmopara halstedii]|uniref:Uncharacterized protein n=1 Tax=Plasmopara halstedii TaxID=4781 RepID=A0A0P1ABG0_PLAHL|nr:uncharacterized protein PHALS_05309 [Plasmopara halstedii]CEG37528.1 hypothetical protein PHALS_05309 [Plasmopara halstedii]|eukprot:XP_024573897.1 hypothetical protein PHALS_05309 [Plasmopara halstedii]
MDNAVYTSGKGVILSSQGESSSLLVAAFLFKRDFNQISHSQDMLPKLSDASWMQLEYVHEFRHLDVLSDDAPVELTARR